MDAKRFRLPKDATLRDVESLSFDSNPDDSDLDAPTICLDTPQHARSAASTSRPPEAAVPEPRQESQGPGQQPARPAPADSPQATSCLPTFQQLIDALRDVNIPDALLRSDCAATHLQSALIGATLQCYPVRSKLVQEARVKSRLGHRMGALVTFEANCDRRLCRSKCSTDRKCATCLHAFSCDCQAKYCDTQWCPHLHLAYVAGLTPYGAEACLYVHSYNHSRVQMRHLRAWLQGAEFMAPLGPDLLRFQEKVLGFGEMWRKLTRYSPDEGKPCECGPDKKCVDCGACRCRYACTCEDFTYGKQLCQHCHWIAMKKSAQADTLFEVPPEESQYQLYDPETGPVSEEVLNVRRYALELQHELSYNFEKNCLGYPFSASRTEWIFLRDQVTVTKLEETDKCICQEHATSQPGKYCQRCKICIYHYKCSCSDAISVICRHIHYVARKSGRPKQGLRSRSHYLRTELFTRYPQNPLISSR